MLEAPELPPAGSPRPPSFDGPYGAAAGASDAADLDSVALNGANSAFETLLTTPQPLAFGATWSPPTQRSPGISL